MSTTLNYTGTLFVKDCCNCGMTFAVPTDFDKRRRDDHALFFCPAGHSQKYTGKTEAQKQHERAVKEFERAQRLERQLANRDEDLRAAKVAHAVTKGKLTKTRKRIAHGVCPCCKRSFANVERHMAGQHPDYVEAAS